MKYEMSRPLGRDGRMGGGAKMKYEMSRPLGRDGGGGVVGGMPLETRGRGRGGQFFGWGEEPSAGRGGQRAVVPTWRW